MPDLLRQALRSDVAELWRVRYAVRENRLTPGRISDAELIAQIESSGRGWVIENQGKLLGFAIGNAENGNIWALFVDPDHAGQGHGRRLHDAMLDWLWSRGLQRLWLSTTPGTRAEAFYRRAGWQDCGLTTGGELRFEIFMAHGRSDPVVPFARGKAACHALQAIGHPVEWHDYPMQHSVCPEEIVDLNRWLLKTLA